MMFIRRPSGKMRSGAAPVHLNVYDLTPINGYAYWLGLGAYHSGVQGEIRASSCSFHWQCTGWSTRTGRTITRRRGSSKESRGSARGLRSGSRYLSGTPIWSRASCGCSWRKWPRSTLATPTTSLPRTAITSATRPASASSASPSHDGSTASPGSVLDPPSLARSTSSVFSCQRFGFLRGFRWSPGFLCTCVLPVQVESVGQRAAEEGKVSADSERRRLRSNSTRFSTAAASRPSSNVPPGSISQPVVTISSGSVGSRRTRRSFSLSSVGAIPSILK
ncbi:hypothetical protein GW17_00043076, partial [Ensete ventricosum]